MTIAGTWARTPAAYTHGTLIAHSLTISVAGPLYLRQHSKQKEHQHGYIGTYFRIFRQSPPEIA